MKRALIMHASDNVANAVEDIFKGDTVSVVAEGAQHTLTAKEEVPFGFKIAVKDIAPGGVILKYTQIIGRASKAIAAGECVHIHNIEGSRGRGDK